MRVTSFLWVPAAAMLLSACASSTPYLEDRGPVRVVTEPDLSAPEPSEKPRKARPKKAEPQVKAE